MNERIEKLAEQANGPNPFFGRLKNQTVLLGDDAVERFAELIVRECANTAYQSLYEDKVFDNSPHNIRCNVMDAIKKHFGVEK